MSGPDHRLERLRSLYVALSAADPSPAGDAGDQEWDVWMNRVAADGNLAGLLHSAFHGQRYTAEELAEHRSASERSGSHLDPASVAEAYRLLAEQ